MNISRKRNIRISITSAVLFLFSIISVFSQKIDEITFMQVGENIEIKYFISQSDNTKATVRLFYSDDNGTSYKLCRTVLGDVGENTILQVENSITWLVVQDLEQLSGNIKFKIELEGLGEKFDQFYKYIEISYPVQVGSTYENVTGYGLIIGFWGKKGIGSNLSVRYQKAKYYNTETSNFTFTFNSYSINAGVTISIASNNAKHLSLHALLDPGIIITKSTYVDPGAPDLYQYKDEINFSIEAGLMLNYKFLNFSTKYSPSFSTVENSSDLDKLPNCMILSLGITF